MKPRLLMAFLLLFSFALAGGASADVDTCYFTTNELDIGNCDTIRIGCSYCIDFDTLGAIDTISIPLYIWSDQNIGGFTLGFHIPGAQGLEFIDWTLVPQPTGAIPAGAALYKTPTRYGIPNSDSVLIGWMDFTGVMSIPKQDAGTAAKLLGYINLKVTQKITQVVNLAHVPVFPPAGPFVLTGLLAPYYPSGTKKLTPKWVHCAEAVVPCDLTLPVEQTAEASLPDRFALSQNVPNPFNPFTAIDFAVPKSGHVTMEIFNVMGQKVRVLVDEYTKAGYKRVEWDGTDQNGNEVASGIYLYRMKAGDFAETKKMLLLK